MTTTKTCTVEHCIDSVLARGYCSKHYQRFKIHGDPNVCDTRRSHPAIKHGRFSTHEYRTWQNIKHRCLNEKAHEYSSYGGRGITICPEWLNSFETFYKDMGDCPNGLSIDRIDVNGNYERSNCRWTTVDVQSINRRISSKNKSGVVGVCYDKSTKHWRAYINYSKRHLLLGAFKDKNTAIEVRKRAELKYHQPLLLAGGTQ